MRRSVVCFAALLPLAMTAACGQKGALYLPPKNGTVVTRPAGAAPAPATAPGSTAPSNPPQDDKDDKKDNSQTPPK